MPDRGELDRLISVITVDCHDLSEQATAICEAFVAEVTLPTVGTVLGTDVDVVDIDIAGHGEHLIARCRRGDVVQDLHLSDVVFDPDTTAGWIHAAYRRWLGLKPHPAAIPEGWEPSWL